jgi:hypothetical protein
MATFGSTLSQDFWVEFSCEMMATRSAPPPLEMDIEYFMKKDLEEKEPA